MKKLFHKVQELRKKAAEIQHAVQAVPGKAAAVREALTMTAGELHQLRADVQSSLNGLRASNEERLLEAMREINNNSLVFEEAGYELTGMELDLSLNQRLAVRLEKFEDVSLTKLRALLDKETRETTRSILTGLIKAEETAANVELTYLTYHGVVVHVGAVPLVRMSWHSDAAPSGEEQPGVAPARAAASTPPPIPTPRPFGSFFGERPVVPLPAASSSVASVTVASSPPASPASVLASQPAGPTSQEAAAPSTSPWSRDALARFKKMPDLSKYRK
jgi:hypothetical protein